MRSARTKEHARDVQAADGPSLSSTERWFLVWFPILSFVVYVLAMPLPATRKVMWWLCMENKPIELATFLLLALGGIMGLLLAWRVRRDGEPTLVWGFFIAVAAFCIVVGGEEVSWGQWFLHYQTPELILELNRQREMNFHNIRGLQGNAEIFRMAISIAGLVVLALYRRPATRAIGAPPIFRTMFYLLLVTSSVEFIEEYFFEAILDIHIVEGNRHRFVQESSEIIEMVIGFAAVAYLHVHMRLRGISYRRLLFLDR